MVIKFMNSFVVALSFLYFCVPPLYCMQYEPDEETDKFRNTVSTSYIFKGYMNLRVAPTRISQINELSEQFPGFQVINNHLLCNACCKGGNELLQDIKQGQTLNTLPPVVKEESSECWYSFHNCMDYAFYTLIIERHPNKDIALKYLTEDVLSFFKIARLEEVADPEEAHAVIYPEGFHYGIYRGNGLVESKWGSIRAVFRHKLWQVDKSYGNRVKFYQVVFLNEK